VTSEGTAEAVPSHVFLSCLGSGIYGLDISVVPAGPGRAPFGHDAAQALQEIKPAVVSFHFGLPSAELLARVRACGSKIVSSATAARAPVRIQPAFPAAPKEAEVRGRYRYPDLRRAKQAPRHRASRAVF
jgi:hypothetical protein